MKWKYKLPETSMLVYYFTKFIGLAPFTLNKNKFHPPTIMYKFYIVSLAVIFYSIKPKLIASIFRRLSESDIPQLVKIGIGSQQLINQPIFLILLISLFANHKVLYIINKLCDIGDEFKILGIEEDMGTFFGNIFATTVATNALIIAICGLLNYLETIWPVFHSIIYSFDVFFHLNIFLTFGYMLLLFKNRFKLINEKLYNVFRPAIRRRSLNHLRIFVACRYPTEEIQTDIKNLTDIERIKKIELVHLELCDLVDRTTDLFGIIILFRSLHFFTELTLILSSIYLTVQYSGQLSNPAEIFLYVMTNNSNSLLKTVLIIVHLFAIAYVSVKTCQEGNATKDILSKVRYETTSQDLEDEFFLFSLQLLHKPVAISIFGILDLDYSYIYKMIFAVTAYVTTMIQLSD